MCLLKPSALKKSIFGAHLKWIMHNMHKIMHILNATAESEKLQDTGGMLKECRGRQYLRHQNSRSYRIQSVCGSSAKGGSTFGTRIAEAMENRRNAERVPGKVVPPALEKQKLSKTGGMPKECRRRSYLRHQNSRSYQIQSAEASEPCPESFCKSSLFWKLMTRRKRL